MSFLEACGLVNAATKRMLNEADLLVCSKQTYGLKFLAVTGRIIK